MPRGLKGYPRPFTTVPAISSVRGHFLFLAHKSIIEHCRYTESPEDVVKACRFNLRDRGQKDLTSVPVQSDASSSSASKFAHGASDPNLEVAEKNVLVAVSPTTPGCPSTSQSQRYNVTGGPLSGDKYASFVGGKSPASEGCPVLGYRNEDNREMHSRNVKSFDHVDVERVDGSQVMELDTDQFSNGFAKDRDGRSSVLVYTATAVNKGCFSQYRYPI
ncbi:hypothetical protein BU15DRAFT_60285 [Melanogaster broomeanus]|nr:hypothetical protein BU15DRAFT_60285 [Melanogaster broomeanus]